MKVLVTGGAGYIGSHTCVALLEAGHEVVVLDNLSRASSAALQRVQEISGCDLRFVEGDVRDQDDLGLAFRDGIDAVLHFAAYKSVEESLRAPLPYFANNVGGTLSLLQAMQHHGTKHLVFSSSASVYGRHSVMPVDESAPLQPEHPYARSKRAMEELIRDLGVADPEFRAVVLRYFNPVGAHPSGRLGEAPSGDASNLMPMICQVAVGERAALDIFGNDYPTCDGTGVRDYLHVCDLAEVHVQALDHQAPGVSIFNLGSGRGYSVLDLVKAFEAANGVSIPRRFVARRAGDIAAIYADTQHAQRLLGWRARRDLAEMCADAWRWQTSASRRANACPPHQPRTEPTDVKEMHQ